MKHILLGKYQDYFKDKDTREEVFMMAQNEDESLEEYVERFNNLQDKGA